jgi:hypothetical protein
MLKFKSFASVVLLASVFTGMSAIARPVAFADCYLIRDFNSNVMVKTPYGSQKIFSGTDMASIWGAISVWGTNRPELKHMDIGYWWSANKYDNPKDVITVANPSDSVVVFTARKQDELRSFELVLDKSKKVDGHYNILGVLNVKEDNKTSVQKIGDVQCAVDLI